MDFDLIACNLERHLEAVWVVLSECIRGHSFDQRLVWKLLHSVEVFVGAIATRPIIVL